MESKSIPFVALQKEKIESATYERKWSSLILKCQRMADYVYHFTPRRD